MQSISLRISIFLGIVIVGSIIWIAAEFFHQSSKFEVDPKLIEQTNIVLPQPYNEILLKTVYNRKYLYHEKIDTTSNQTNTITNTQSSTEIPEF
ncbi:MAG: hypothetical protein N3A71_00875 [Candidatus Dojkabacteria bacterium]|nr:hypothetical protein [Candidatus Dojkabacteria bacterium]